MITETIKDHQKNICRLMRQQPLIFRLVRHQPVAALKVGVTTHLRNLKHAIHLYKK